MPSDPDVIENEAERRYELVVDGHTAVVDYRPHERGIALVHTFVPGPIERRGVATRLVTEIFERARASGQRIVPHCAFVREFAERHPEYADVVAP